MKYKDLLNEAQNYDDMFKKIFDAYEKLDLDPTDLRDYLKTRMDFSKRFLKKSDRIIWYLRYVKIDLILNRLNKEIYKNNEIYEPLEIDVKKTAAKGNINLNSPIISPYAIEGSISHFLSLPIQKIQNFVFTNQPYSQVIDQFETWEEEWKEKTKGLVEPQDGDKEIIKFGDGYSWWLLDRGSCDLEANAMGHCGNVPSEKYGDRILSFRKNVYENFWEPHLTFILDKNGRIGESKGRGNEKPVEKYHPYIAALLKRSDIIKGIKGGGYMPQNNFNLNDLDDDLREEVLEANPDLEINVILLYKKEGLTPRVENLAIDSLEKAGLDIYSMNENETILKEYDDISRFIRDMSTDFKILDSAVDFYEEIQDEEDIRSVDSQELEDLATDLNTIPDDYVDILSRLPDNYIKKIAASVNYNKSITNRNQLYDLADLIEKTKYGNVLRMAMIDATNADLQSFDKEEFIEYINLLLNIYTSSSENHYAYIKPIKNMEDSIVVAMPTNNVIDMAYAAYLDNEDSLPEYSDDWLSEEELIIYREVRYNNNWIYVDSYRLSDDDLSWIQGEDKEIYEKYKKMVEVKNIKNNTDMVSQNFDQIQAAKFFMKYIDLNESQLNRLKKLAGI